MNWGIRSRTRRLLTHPKAGDRPSWTGGGDATKENVAKLPLMERTGWWIKIYSVFEPEPPPRLRRKVASRRFLDAAPQPPSCPGGQIAREYISPSAKTKVANHSHLHRPRLPQNFGQKLGCDLITRESGQQGRGLKRAGVDGGEVSPKGGAAGVVSVISRSTPDTDLICKYESALKSLTRSMS
jgi:hypothetical protein